jgi:hypothetical protein
MALLKVAFPNFESSSQITTSHISTPKPQPVQSSSIQPENDNLHYYNIPIEPYKAYDQLKPSSALAQAPVPIQQPMQVPMQQPIQTQQPMQQPIQTQTPMQVQQVPIQVQQKVETFDNTLDDQHLMSVKHVLECEKCKTIMLKQLNIETDRRRNEDIMEIISYIIFSIFILMLIDQLAK